MKDINNIRPLCLSFWTPPLVRPQSILIGKMIPEWLSQGLNPVIITYDVCGDWSIDLPVYKFSPYKINKYLAKIFPIRLFLRYFYFKKLFWQAKKIIKKHNINIVFSFSNPQESNILGAMLKKKLGIKFISHFSDPWYDNPYKFFSGLAGKKVLAQEKFVIKNSDKVIFTNEAAKDLVMKKYPENWTEKTGVVPHCFDLKDYPEAKKEDSDKFIISYIGAFYKKRNPEPLLQALQKIINKRPDFIRKFKIELIGATNDYAGYNIKSIEDMAARYGLKGNVEVIPPVSYKESLKYMKLSDCLVVIDADMSGSPFLPSKVVDYAGSGNNILGITPKNSPTAQFIKDLGCKSFSYDQVDELAEYLQKLISGEINIEINREFLNKYSVQNTTVKLIKQFNEVLNNSN